MAQNGSHQCNGVHDMDISDKAFNTYLSLKNATWLNNSDEDILAACKELAEYLAEHLKEAA
jgi:hypothetical protein